VIPRSEPPRSTLRRTLRLRGLSVAALFAALLAAGIAFPDVGVAVDPSARNLPPSLAHPFGTDALGRDLAQRTLGALAASMTLGIAATLLSTALAIALAFAAAAHHLADRVVGVLTDLALGLPHFVLIMLIAYAAGGGVRGVILGVGLTHWPRLARLLRQEAQRVTASEYVQVSRALGRGPAWIARHHLIAHLAPQAIAGFVLTFPHAILHEAGLSFLGLGLPPYEPSIGVMLAESRSAILAGRWWAALWPGLGLMAIALAFERFGEALRRTADPNEGVA
jgi:peptide/nickel transport system permease protein